MIRERPNSKGIIAHPLESTRWCGVFATGFLEIIQSGSMMKVRLVQMELFYSLERRMRRLDRRAKDYVDEVASSNPAERKDRDREDRSRLHGS